MPSSINSLAVLTTLSFGLLSGCAHAPKVYSKRIRETPAGERIAPGAVIRTEHTVRVSMEHNIAHINVFESSVCPVIKMRTVQRIEETLDGSRVVERVDKGAREYSETQNAMMECEARFSRVPVQLQYDADTYPLGGTDQFGQLNVDLAAVMKVNTRGVDLSTQTGILLVNGTPKAEISMAGLLKQQQRLDTIISHLSALLGKDLAKLTDADVTNAGMLYEEMRELAPDDARTVSLQRRFVEVASGFRGIQNTAALKRNLGALSEAKELLVALNAKVAVPSYVQVSISQDSPTDDALAWARAQVLVSLRQNAALCAGGFDWARVAQLQGVSRIAFAVYRGAYDGSDLSWLTGACGR
jgi:hypothetical protein